VFQKELRDETNRLASLTYNELVSEVTRRREVRRIKGLDAKAYLAQHIGIGGDKLKVGSGQTLAVLDQARDWPFLLTSSWKWGWRPSSKRG
jgi:hypothetical protein